MRLHVVDHLILVAYLVGMMLLGWRLSKRQHSDEEYFLGGRRMPWFAVGVSLIATLLSSVAYLGTPGVVWRFGFAIFLNTLVGIAITVVLVLFVTIPFFVRFRFTTAYEYLEHRFNLSVRLLGATMFLLFMTIYMGVIVLLSARALAVATELPLVLIIVSVGTVATLYTMMGGIRAVIWTDVIQVALLVGGGLFAIGYVAVSTGSGPLEWIQAVNARDNEIMPLASLDPTIPATVVTLILGGCLWTLMAHTANQTIMQRYFSTVDMRAAKRSYVTSAAVDVLLLVLLTVIGASLIYYFTQGAGTLPPDLDPASGKDRDGIFPYFVATRIPAGLAGAIFAALLAASMSTIDSGVNSFATVATIDFGRLRRRQTKNHVVQARVITLVVGLAVTMLAVFFDRLTGTADIPTILPKTFNSLAGGMGGLFLAGMLIPRAGSRAVWPAALVGVGTALGVAYSGELLRYLGPSAVDMVGGWVTPEFAQRLAAQGMGFTWIIPSSTAASLGTAWLLSFVFPNRDPERIRGLTWATRREPSPYTGQGEPAPSRQRPSSLGGATSLSPSFDRWVESKHGARTFRFFSSKGRPPFPSFSRCGGKDERRRGETMPPLGFSRMRGRKTAPGTTPLLC